MGAHALAVGGGFAGGQVASVLREDMSESVCGRKEFTQVSVEGCLILCWCCVGVTECPTCILNSASCYDGMLYEHWRSDPSFLRTAHQPLCRHRHCCCCLRRRCCWCSKQVEDRPVTKERVERIVEHRPVEKEYVTEVR
jgi:hypothetical protein